MLSHLLLLQLLLAVLHSFVIMFMLSPSYQYYFYSITGTLYLPQTVSQFIPFVITVDSKVKCYNNILQTTGLSLSLSW